MLPKQAKFDRKCSKMRLLILGYATEWRSQELMMGGVCPSTIRGFGECRKLHSGSGHTFFSILGQMWPISVTYLSDYSLSNYLFFTMYIKKFFPRASGGF